MEPRIIKLRDIHRVTAILVTHQLQDAFYIATHHALMENGQPRIVQAIEHVTEDVRFIMLKDGQIYFQGSAAELLGSQDP